MTADNPVHHRRSRPVPGARPADRRTYCNPGDAVFAPYGKEHKIFAIGLGYMGLSANYDEAEPDNMRKAEL